MTLPPIERYTGREQAYVKHYFLATYIERLVHKVAGSYDEIVYVDGFSGPWQNDGDDFADTSFGIALQALRAAKASWKVLGRDIKMKAILVERKASSHAALLTLQPKFPDITIQPLHADFRSAVSNIKSGIPANAFAFILIDPKGWRIPIEAIAPLLSRPNTEILFNFMFDFINRAASMSAPVTVNGLDELLPVDGWREALAEIDTKLPESDRPAARKVVLIDAFRRVLRDRGGYPYVAEIPVLRPVKDRTLYSLVYATRNSKGIEVFRDCQIKTIREQEVVRGAAKVARNIEDSGQGDMFGTTHGFGPDLISQFLQSEQGKAEELLLALANGSKWGSIWPEVLTHHAVRRTELNVIAARLRKEGKLVFPNWQAGKRVPDDGYQVQRG